jgi:MoaA/NifB/PqqE/SkfB family radical SAM enzyme
MQAIPSVNLIRLATLAWAMAPYLTLKKLLNLLRCEWEKLRRVVHPRSFPYVAVIDVVNACNLRCPYCPTGARRQSGRKKIMVEPAQVQRLIDEYGDYLISAHLYNWGEPLLHPQIADLVKMFHSRRIFTTISTNLNIKNPKLLENLCEANLDHLVISLSGANQETYARYHRQGSLELVLENVDHLVKFKRNNNLRKPLIEFKYLLFKYNQPEVEAARKLGADLRVDFFRPFQAGGAEEVTVGDAQIIKPHFPSFNYCHHLWHMVVLNSDGGVAPCCYLYFKEDDFGDYSHQSHKNIRQNQMFVTARQLFVTGKTDSLPPDLQHPCLKCHVVHEQTHLKEYLQANPHAKPGHRTGGD